MDKQINKVKKDVKHAESNLKKGDKDIKKLLKMDKVFDKYADAGKKALRKGKK